ncbi:UBC-like protein [Dendrothele bispora CBS 962.96]|uniref:UBC-like protein n=1 Tax=Dendrothele bispora (strain CBS 962.96) TaxID=1314807 RepID=A0A4S8MBP9_DENBC|nr:UBC-like protein [Dendrothele bispora CBS 962.96]THV01727.1 UBC-like protein [Dendrothele bispora CBS 962.96]
MASTSSMNKNNSAVKRIMQEARELANDPSTDYTASPLEDDIFEWHCTLRGTPGTEFEGGLYHIRILLPSEYPFRPPSLMVLTPNGRFELNTKICISFTNYHEELWQPAWGVRTAILGLQGFFPLKGQAAVGVGSIEYPVAERRRLAVLSRDWVCPHCQQPNSELLPDPPSISGPGTESQPPETLETPAQNLVNTVSPLELPSPPAPVDTPSPIDESPIPSSTPETEAPGPEIAQDQPEPLVVPETPQPTRAVGTAEPSSPTWLLDAAIGVILALVFALIFRRLF